MNQSEIEKHVDDKMGNIFWTVILKHLTPEVHAFIRQELIAAYKEGRDSK